MLTLELNAVAFIYHFAVFSQNQKVCVADWQEFIRNSPLSCGLLVCK